MPAPRMSPVRVTAGRLSPTRVEVEAEEWALAEAARVRRVKLAQQQQLLWRMQSAPPAATPILHMAHSKSYPALNGLPPIQGLHDAPLPPVQGLRDAPSPSPGLLSMPPTPGLFAGGANAPPRPPSATPLHPGVLVYPYFRPPSALPIPPAHTPTPLMPLVMDLRTSSVTPAHAVQGGFSAGGFGVLGPMQDPGATSLTPMQPGTGPPIYNTHTPMPVMGLSQPQPSMNGGGHGGGNGVVTPLINLVNGHALAYNVPVQVGYVGSGNDRVIGAHIGR